MPFVHALNLGLLFFLTGLWLSFPEVSHTLPMVGVGGAMAALLYALTLLDPSASWYNLPQKEAILALPADEQRAIFQKVHGLFYMLATTVLTMITWASVAILDVVPGLTPDQAVVVGVVFFIGVEGATVGIWLAWFSNDVKKRTRAHEARVTRDERTGTSEPG